MSERTIRLHTFCSVKGGVGKTTLAIVCAKILAAQGRVPVLIDCDLTGTSLADGLDLRAPNVKLHEDGSIDFEAEPTGLALVDAKESRNLIRSREAAIQQDERWRERPHPPVFLNDILDFVSANERVPRMDALFWRHMTQDQVLYLPSSSILEDVRGSLGWFYEEPFAWAGILARILHALARQVETLTDVVVDLPPGTWGFAHQMLNIVSMLHFQDERPLPEEYAFLQDDLARWIPNPFIVASRDPNDFVPALQYVVQHRQLVPTLTPVLNRLDKGMAAVKSKIAERLPNVLEHIELEKILKDVQHIDVLAQLFWSGNVNLDKIPANVIKTLRLEEK